MDPFLCQLDDPVDSDGRWSGQFLKRNTRIRKPLPGPVTVFFARLEWVIFLPELVKLLGLRRLRQHWHHHLNMALSADCWWTKIFLSWTDLRAFYLAHVLLLLMTFWLSQPQKTVKSEISWISILRRLPEFAAQRAQRGGLPLRQAWAAETSHLQGRAGRCWRCCATWPAWRVVSTRRRRSPPSSWRLRTQLRKMAVQFSGRSLRRSQESHFHIMRTARTQENPPDLEVRTAIWPLAHDAESGCWAELLRCVVIRSSRQSNQWIDPLEVMMTGGMKCIREARRFFVAYRLEIPRLFNCIHLGWLRIVRIYWVLRIYLEYT